MTTLPRTFGNFASIPTRTPGPAAPARTPLNSPAQGTTPRSSYFERPRLSGADRFGARGDEYSQPTDPADVCRTLLCRARGDRTVRYGSSSEGRFRAYPGVEKAQALLQRIVGDDDALVEWLAALPVPEDLRNRVASTVNDPPGRERERALGSHSPGGPFELKGWLNPPMNLELSDPCVARLQLGTELNEDPCAYLGQVSGQPLVALVRLYARIAEMRYAARPKISDWERLGGALPPGDESRGLMLRLAKAVNKWPDEIVFEGQPLSELTVLKLGIEPGGPMYPLRKPLGTVATFEGEGDSEAFLQALRRQDPAAVQVTDATLRTHFARVEKDLLSLFNSYPAPTPGFACGVLHLLARAGELGLEGDAKIYDAFRWLPTGDPLPASGALRRLARVKGWDAEATRDRDFRLSDYKPRGYPTEESGPALTVRRAKAAEATVLGFETPGETGPELLAALTEDLEFLDPALSAQPIERAYAVMRLLFDHGPRHEFSELRAALTTGRSAGTVAPVDLREWPLSQVEQHLTATFEPWTNLRATAVLAGLTMKLPAGALEALLKEKGCSEAEAKALAEVGRRLGELRPAEFSFVCSVEGSGDPSLDWVDLELRLALAAFPSEKVSLEALFSSADPASFVAAVGDRLKLEDLSSRTATELLDFLASKVSNEQVSGEFVRTCLPEGWAERLEQKDRLEVTAGVQRLLDAPEASQYAAMDELVKVLARGSDIEANVTEALKLLAAANA